MKEQGTFTKNLQHIKAPSLPSLHRGILGKPLIIPSINLFDIFNVSLKQKEETREHSYQKLFKPEQKISKSQLLSSYSNSLKNIGKANLRYYMGYQRNGIMPSLQKKFNKIVLKSGSNFYLLNGQITANSQEDPLKLTMSHQFYKSKENPQVLEFRPKTANEFFSQFPPNVKRVQTANIATRSTFSSMPKMHFFTINGDAIVPHKRETSKKIMSPDAKKIPKSFLNSWKKELP